MTFRALTIRMFAATLVFSTPALAEEDKIELETTRIKANKELPQILYIVPWKDFEAPTGQDRKLTLHDFFGDLYQPILATRSSEVEEASE